MTDTAFPGYNGVLLEVDLTAGRTTRIPLSPEDARLYIGGRGLGMKLLAGRLGKPGVDAMSPENPLLFMPGPFSGFPIPSASRTCVVTKSPRTSPLRSKLPKASTVSYANMGGFFGPEIRFAGYDAIVVTGRAAKPVYIHIDDDKVEVRDASKYWGMGTDEFDRRFIEDLGDRRFRTCYIGPSGENLVPYASILNTAARAAGRGGVGGVMGSKNLKAVAVRGTGMPGVADPEKFQSVLAAVRKDFQGSFPEGYGVDRWRRYGTAAALLSASANGVMAVKNYSLGTFDDVDTISGVAAEREIWSRDFACYCCPLSCKKAGVVRGGPYAGHVHDGPEYETGGMMGSNLMINDLGALMKAIFEVDDLGLDQISTGNVIGFLMEAYEKKLVDKAFLDGIDLAWGNADAVLAMVRKIARREGVGDLAARGRQGAGRPHRRRLGTLRHPLQRARIGRLGSPPDDGPGPVLRHRQPRRVPPQRGDGPRPERLRGDGLARRLPVRHGRLRQGRPARSAHGDHGLRLDRGRIPEGRRTDLQPGTGVQLPRGVRPGGRRSSGQVLR